ncbi:MAG TPA: MoaD/ThiS family protein [Phycisphaerae bacterium]|nr:MoaD/ThiS family protein [Phycisphaerae bacterium]
MIVNVKFFAVYRDLTGEDTVQIECNAGTDGAALLDKLRERFPALASLQNPGRLAVNCEFAPLDTALQDQDEVTFIAPVSGG